jgi:hypothetical protein
MQLQSHVAGIIVTYRRLSQHAAGLIQILRNRAAGTTASALCPRESELVALFNLVPRQTLIRIN